MIKVILSALFLLIFLAASDIVHAQVCGGSQTCCPAGGLTEECVMPDGFTVCTKGFPGCTCQVTCTDVTQNCTFRGSGNTNCSTSWNSSNCDYIYGSCNVSGGGGGGGGPVCGNGVCEFGESTASCPHDCPPSSTPPPPPPGVCTVGDPFTGISNCGEVGRQNGSGSCGAGCMCCAFLPPVGASCTVLNSVPPRLTLRVGEVAQIKVNVRATTSGTATWGGISVTANPPGLGTAGVASVFPTSVNMCCGIADGLLFGPTDTRGTLSVLGLSPGFTTISVYADTSRNDVNCRGYTPQVTVLPVSDVPSLNLTINGTSPSVTLPAGGGNVTLNWTSNDVTSCTATDDWSGSKPIVGPESQGVVSTPKKYTLTCDGPDGQVTDSVVANVTGVIGPMSVDIKGGGRYSSGSDGPILANVGQGVVIGWLNSNIDTTKGCFRTSNPVDPRWNNSVSPNFNPQTGARALGHPNNIAMTVVPMSPTTYTMTCYQNGNNTVAGSDSLLINTRSQCNDPVDLVPQMTCSPDGVQNGLIKWRWEAVPLADRYSVSIVDQTGATVTTLLPTTPTGSQNPGFFGCSYTNVQDSTNICSVSTFLPPGSPAKRYHAVISVNSSTNACTPLVGTVTPEYTVPTCLPTSWWQGGNGDVITQGLISSNIPTAITTPNNRILQDGPGGYPGIALTAPSSTVDSGSGVVSRPNWSVQATYNGRDASYNDYVDLIPTSVTPYNPNASQLASWSDFTSGSVPANATDANGYTWYQHSGDLTITDDINIGNSGRKVILFVSGNLTFRGKVNITNLSTGFFMTLVGGDIALAPTVTTAGAAPTLTGMFYCGGHFTTGTGGASSDGRLNILGSVAALGGVTLERDLGPGNLTEPAETFTSSPALLLNYPPALTFKRPIWREVAP